MHLMRFRSMMARVMGLSLFFTTAAAAQLAPSTDRTYYTTLMSWFETDALLKLGKGFGTQLDIQIRTAADQEGQPDRNTANIFANPFQFLARPWLLYDVGNSGVRFGISPMGYGATWNYYTGSYTVSAEARTTLQAQYNSRAGRVYLTNRLRYEFRWLGPRVPVDGGWSIPSAANDDLISSANERGRIRYMLRGWIPISRHDLSPGTWYVSTFDEVFFNVGGNVPSTNIFDQNRFYIGIGRQQKSKIRWEVGYMIQVQSRYNREPYFNNVDVNHILSTWLFFDDLAKVF